MSTHQATFQVDYAERRSRLTTFLRLILILPHAIVLTLFAIATVVVVFVVWFAVVITRRYPQGMHELVANYTRYQARVYGYLYLLVDPYPPFSGSRDLGYPAQLRIPPAKAEYDRMKALFRLILLIPVALISYAMSIVAEIGALLSWVVIVVTGRQPRGLQDMTALGVSYQVRAAPYMFLLTEDWPSFTDPSGSAASSDRLPAPSAPSATAPPAFGAFATDDPAGPFGDRPGGPPSAPPAT